jgi:DTW domain-containing protein YfiP
LLAARCLASSVVVVDGPVPPSVRDGEGPMALLFPSEGARELSKADGPLTLVVPDGTWRQARKMRTRTKGLAGLPCVTLPPGPTTTYQLRAERREHGLSTLEAIARAFGILEGPAIEDALLAIQRVMVDRTLWLRGVKRDDDVFGGVPEAARLHDPRGGLPRS